MTLGTYAHLMTSSAAHRGCPPQQIVRAAGRIDEHGLDQP
jgi:hypothetical protein